MVKAIILFLVDKRNWVFDFTARSIACRLSDRFRIIVRYVDERPDLSREKFDLLYVFFWGESWHERFGVEPSRLIKGVSSFRWRFEEKYGHLTPSAFVDKYLQECSIVITPALKLFDILDTLRGDVFVCPNGIESELFCYDREDGDALRIGWVGNPNDKCKGLEDILIPACAGRFRFEYANGRWSRRQVAEFYNKIDVLAVASVAEGEPLPLIESMVCGCFPVTTDVGIVPELVRSGYNGLIVERSVESFREAFDWCERHLEQVRRAGKFNSLLVTKTMSWDFRVRRFAEIFEYALQKQQNNAPLAPSAVPPQSSELSELMELSKEKFDALCSAAESFFLNSGRSRRFRLKIGGYLWKMRDRRIKMYQIGSKIRRDGFVRFIARCFIPLSWRPRIKRLLRIQG